MKLENLDQEIAEIENKREGVLKSMELVSKRVIEDSIVFLREWNKKVTDEGLQKHPEEILKLGSEGVGNVKKEIANLDNRIDSQATSALDKDEIWFHRRVIPRMTKPGSVRIVERNSTESFDEVLRKLMGHIARILKKYSLIRVTNSTQWEVISGGVLRYSIAYQKTANLDKALAEYAELNQEYNSHEKNIESLKKKKEEIDAKKLWNDS